MQNTGCVIFDLDGTLLVSHDTIYYATVKTLDELGIAYKMDRTGFNNMIGLHFQEIFDAYQIEVTDFNHFIHLYKSLYFNYIDDSYLYEDANNLLERLNNYGIKTALLTTKSQDQADKITEHFGISPNLNYIVGRRDNFPNKPDPGAILHICKTLGVNPENTIMVGDSEVDIECGNAAGVITCGITHGYRTAKALRKAEPDYIVNNLNEIAGLAGLNTL